MKITKVAVEENIKLIINGFKKINDFSNDEIREMIIYKRNPVNPEGFKVLKIENENKIFCQLWNGMKVYYIYKNGDFQRKL